MRSFARNKLRVRKRVNRVFAVAAGPKPPRISSSPPGNGVIGSSRSPPAKPVNGVSMKVGDVSHEIKRVREQMEENSECLPLLYEPASISAYWGKWPRAVVTRIVQLLSIAGGFLSRLAMHVINKKVKKNEVARAIELREIVTSLGPAYIKFGQALSIRPDILSPVAMTELQKLCDKVSVDMVGLVDEWTAYFFEKLDYVNEGRNGTLFAE
ncbi:hypothetical protein L6164_016585 [Bauhinia variegata]|uniref:Uncharacterized protein n=1 Tax=Bauhinia variegata TaxID=167791 RepID=A0ACB9NPU6_BAUVA|nr:hypothetical protein L6164_016585 [Bauhinia variegata]